MHGFWFVLAIGVHHHRHFAAGSQQAFADRAGEPAAAHPADQMNARILPSQLAHQLRGAIGGIVVNNDQLQLVVLAQQRSQLLHHRPQVVALVEGGQHHAEAQELWGDRHGRGAQIQSDQPSSLEAW